MLCLDPQDSNLQLRWRAVSLELAVDPTLKDDLENSVFFKKLLVMWNKLNVDQ